jgi:hypothetical protein
MSDMVENDPDARTTSAKASFGLLPGEGRFSLNTLGFGLCGTLRESGWNTACPV